MSNSNFSDQYIKYDTVKVQKFDSVDVKTGDNIYKYSEYFVNMVLSQEPNQLLKKIFQDINDLKVDVAYPFLLEVYDDYKKVFNTS